MLEPSAVQFCARKISAVAGDMRKALDVCRRSVELVEQDIRGQQVLTVTGNLIYFTERKNGVVLFTLFSMERKNGVVLFLYIFSLLNSNFTT